MKLKQLCFLLVLPFICACEDTDDVLGIFTGRDWKLTGVFEKGKPEHPYQGLWDSTSDREVSMQLLSQANNFILTFYGNETNGVVSGEFDGRATSTSLSGAWSANGKSNETAFTLKGSPTDKDILGQEFIKGLRTAYSYDGDYNNLRLHYKVGAISFYLMFRRID